MRIVLQLSDVPVNDLIDSICSTPITAGIVKPIASQPAPLRATSCQGSRTSTSMRADDDDVGSS